MKKLNELYENMGVIEIDRCLEKIVLHPFVWLPALIGGFLAMTEPDGIDRNSVILALVNFSSYYTGIYTLVKHNTNPSSALVFFAIIFSAFPFQCIFLWIKMSSEKLTTIAVERYSKYSKLKIIIMTTASIPLLIGYYFAIFFIWQEPFTTTKSIIGTKIGMITINSLAVIFFPILCFYLFAFLFNIRKIFKNFVKEDR